VKKTKTHKNVQTVTKGKNFLSVNCLSFDDFSSPSHLFLLFLRFLSLFLPILFARFFFTMKTKILEESPPSLFFIYNTSCFNLL